MNIRYSKDSLQEIIAKSISWSSACRLLGIKPATGAQTYLKKRAIDFGIDYSHFWSVNKLNSRHKLNQRIPLDKFLVPNGPEISSHKLKIKLIRDGIKIHRCESCGGVEWMGEAIPIELHHVNGNRTDNRIENLQILCPNCHSLTPNNSGKSLRRIGGIGRHV